MNTAKITSNSRQAG